jgi:hypothetical protein
MSSGFILFNVKARGGRNFMMVQTKVAGLALILSVFLAAPSMAQEKKAKAEKVSGDIGLLDTEKNYMIVVTKEGKLVTIDYNDKTKVTALKPGPAKMSDIGLGTQASVQYTKKGDKNYLTAIEYLAKKSK